VAVQESRRNPKALKHLLITLGPQWQIIISDVTEGSTGNGERLAYVYDTDRVQPSGLVGEIVLPPIEDEPARQFARTPYTASFTRDGVEFTLASVHVLWGKSPAERLPEITAFAEWMRAWRRASMSSMSSTANMTRCRPSVLGGGFTGPAADAAGA
jgi:hypothetical protein